MDKTSSRSLHDTSPAKRTTSPDALHRSLHKLPSEEAMRAIPTTSPDSISPSAIYRDTLEPEVQIAVDDKLKEAKKFLNSKQYRNALKKFGEVYTIQWQNLGPRHLNTADTMHQIGLTYMKLRDYKKAKEFLEHASTTYERTLGPQDRKFAATLYDWSRTRRDQAKSMNEPLPNEIKEKLQWAHDIYAMYSDPFAATIQHNLGAFHWQRAQSMQGESRKHELEKAELAYQEELAILEKHKEVGPKHTRYCRGFVHSWHFLLGAGKVNTGIVKREQFYRYRKAQKVNESLL